MIERKRDIDQRTLFIAPESGRLMDLICNNRNIYKSSLIHEHARNQTNMSEASMKKHILCDNETGK